jgi:ParB-like chromosome segregation protein Spo0J
MADVQMQIRDRIKELRRVPANELRPNPRNWRTHPNEQRDALRGALAEVGYADALLARELADGGLELVDGHLRAETTPDAVVPVLVLDVTEEEAAKILLTLDPLAGLAGVDQERLTDLLAGVQFASPQFEQLLEGLANPSGQAALPLA